MRKRLKIAITVELDLEVETTNCYGLERDTYDIVNGVESDVADELNEHLMYEEPEEGDLVQRINELGTRVERMVLGEVVLA